MEELKDKEENHKKIMAIDNKDEWELDKGLYRKVLERIKKKGKRMFNLLNKAGEKYKDSVNLYIRKIIKKEQIPFQFSYTSLVPIWKKKGSALDFKMMRFIHSKEWEARLCEAIVTEHMKPNIVKACLLCSPY